LIKLLLIIRICLFAEMNKKKNSKSGLRNKIKKNKKNLMLEKNLFLKKGSGLKYNKHHY